MARKKLTTTTKKSAAALSQAKVRALVKSTLASEKNKSYAGTIGTLDLGGNADKMRKVSTSDLNQKYYEQSEPLRKAIDTAAKGVVVGGYHLNPWKGEKMNDRHAIIIHRFLDEPNDEDEWSDMLRDISLDMLTYGDAYQEITVDVPKYMRFKRQLNDSRVDPYNVDLPYKLYRLNPKTMKIETDSHGKVTKYVQQNGTEKIKFNPEQVIHYKFSSPLDDTYGLAPGATLKNLIASYIYATVYNADFFENNATPRLHIDLGTGAKQEDINAFITLAEKNLKGQPHKNLVTGGGVVVKPISLRNDEEFQEYRKGIMLEILSQVGVPPFVAGIVDGNGGSAPDQINIFKSLCVKPIQQIEASRINRKIIKQLFIGVKLTFKFNPVDSLDAGYVAELDERDLRNQIRTVNEVRAARGLPPVAWGDQPIIPFSDASMAQLPGSGSKATGNSDDAIAAKDKEIERLKKKLKKSKKSEE